MGDVGIAQLIMRLLYKGGKLVWLLSTQIKVRCNSMHLKPQNRERKDRGQPSKTGEFWLKERCCLKKYSGECVKEILAFGLCLPHTCTHVWYD